MNRKRSKLLVELADALAKIGRKMRYIPGLREYHIMITGDTVGKVTEDGIGLAVHFVVPQYQAGIRSLRPFLKPLKLEAMRIGNNYQVGQPSDHRISGSITRCRLTNPLVPSKYGWWIYLDILD